MSDMEREYLERRRQECLKRAETAADPAIGKVHREFAAAYDRRLDTDTAGEPRIIIWN